MCTGIKRRDFNFLMGAVKIEYYQKMSLHAQIGSQGAEK